MPQITQLGQINLAALNVPDLIVRIIPPQLLINGVPSNVIGFVGTASWGPKNVPAITGGYQGYTVQFGLPVARKYDMGTAVWAATQQGAQVFRCVRVTDGTDTAAVITVQTNCITYTAIYTGTGGNNIVVTHGPGTAKNSKKVVISKGSQVPEIFDNILSGVASLTVTPGAYTVAPTGLTVAAPDQAPGVQAVANPYLVVTGTPTVSAGGAGYVANDQITLANGVVIKVLTVTGGAVTTLQVLNPGVVPAGATAPTSPMAQVSTTGAGTGATFTVTWGLAAELISGSAGYSTAPLVSIVGGTGAGGAVTANVAYWANIAAAINNGQSGLRGPSQLISATVGAGTASPTTGSVTLSGGTDGASATNIGVAGVPSMMGLDTVPRTGMYAMRAANVSIGVLVDVDDSTTWTTQTSFGVSEGIYMIGVGPVGDSIANAATVKANAGIDASAFKLMFGDWTYINDPVSGARRLVSPQGFVAGFMGNQDPSQTPMNKPMFGIVDTQKSVTKLTYADADLQALSAAGIDVICNPNPGGAYFALRLGINTSSNLATNGDNYTRMTFFIAKTIARGCGSYVGQLQSPDERLRAKTTLTAFFSNLQKLGMIGDVNNPGSDGFQVVLDKSNNPSTLVALGYQFAYCKVIYLSVIRYFIIDLEGGQTVTITNQLPTGASNVGQLTG